ncbi:MAG TPA: hypothetical protein VM843_05530, partial [Flavisolibacter sp.]|nr:hypothetical protein [Flavisolibacter sp.]
AERLGGNELSGSFQQAKAAADKAIAELMGELSEFGDASKGDINKDHKLFAIWNQAITTLEDLTVEQKEKTLAELEMALKESYVKTLSEEMGLPESVIKVFERQSADIQSATK